MDQGVEVVGRQDEAVSGAVVSPPAQHEVAAKRVLQRAGQVLVEDGVEVAVVASCVKKTTKTNKHRMDGSVSRKDKKKKKLHSQ